MRTLIALLVLCAVAAPAAFGSGHALHNFALGSVTANKRSFTGSVPGKGTKTYRITLIAGTYAYACSAHPTTMHGQFTVS